MRNWDSISPLLQWLFAGLILLGLAFTAVGFYWIVEFQAHKGAKYAHSRQIHLALSEYAIDHDGNFPSAEKNSNEAFRKLFDQRFQEERIFFVHGSAWHDSLPDGQSKPDNDVGDPPDYLNGLTRGENHWAYQTGLNPESPVNLPLIMDGFSDQLGVYSEDPDERGGVWEGKAAIVVRVDGSGKIEKPDESGRVKKDVNGKPVDIFSKEYGPEPANLLNPW